MKIFQKIIALILVCTIFNLVLGKAIHEFFEHDHKAHTCEFAGTLHFHEAEVSHIDFICNFNFSASLLESIVNDFNQTIFYKKNKIKIHFLGLSKNLCYRLISLRGPPVNV